MNEAKSAVTGTAAKAADRFAIDILGIPSLELMERASRYVTDHILEHFPDTDPDRTVRVLVMSSVGNNGVDGVCIARQLLDERGAFHPVVLLCGFLEKATWELLHQLAEYKKRGGEIYFLCPDAPGVPAAVREALSGRMPGGEKASFAGLCSSADLFSSADVIVDALFGIGLRRPVEGLYKDLIGAANAAGTSGSCSSEPCITARPVKSGMAVRPMKIAVDVPSGINADDGRCMGICFQADATLTFGRNKTGLLTGDGPAAAGEVTVCDIGIPDEAYTVSA
ncbi:MAG: NAD(P)H-hydrate epimerase [Lachnospiraceae bacterium]|nr:NAD(P)H-hydrate epimerase [Lachnospiraceae bacterium]